MSSYKCQEKVALTSHDCVLIYKSETEGDRNHASSSSFIGLTTRMLKVKRLEEISSSYSSNPLEKMAFFQCMEEVEKVKCFLEENSSELDSTSGDDEAEDKVWSSPALNEKIPVKGGRTSALTERTSQKDHFSEKEKVKELNKKNAEKTNVSVVQRSFATCHTEKQDEVDDFLPENSTEPRENAGGKDGVCMETLGRQENNSGKRRGSADTRGFPLFQGEENGLPSKGDTGGREEQKGGATAAKEMALEQRSSGKQRAEETNAPCERCTNSVKSLCPPGSPGNPATASTFQNVEQTESAGSSKRRVTEVCFLHEENKKSRTDAAGTREECAARTEDATQAQPRTATEQDVAAPLGDVPTPAAPFDHRIVTAKRVAVDSLYTVSKTEILGGGRFGQVHKCEEKASGLKLAAKIIKTRGAKDKENVKNEISVMNQLDHVNLIQLYDAFESKHDFILVMEYVEGGELFDRIIDENCSLTELDTIVFIKQICEGIRHMHQMCILHLDLKPENILCVNRDAKQIKIIDFGLARRYKPREKLKVNFGTPEFLAPEVVNYDFVSFSTDMWSVGVITYMLWDLEDDEFQDISEEAREFISKLLVKEKSWRISASEALKHPWLSDHKLHSRLNSQKNRSADAQNPTTK